MTPETPIRRVFRVVNGGTPTSDPENWDGDVPWATPVDLARVNGGVLRTTERTLSARGLATGSRTVRGGSLILSTRAPIGYVAEVRAPTSFNQGCRGLELITDGDVRFFRYQLSSATERLIARGQGSTFVELSGDALASFPVAAPPLDEQRAIADHLDRETARIDALIAAKQRSLALLKERWRASREISILRGCDPVTGRCPVEVSGTIRALSQTITLQRGHDLPADERVEGPIPVISSGGISGSHNVSVCAPPGVVTGRYGTIGEVYYAGEPYWPLNTTLYVSDFRGNAPRWVFHMLAALPLNIDEEKSAVTGINRNVVGALRVPVPSAAEQRAVADRLDAERFRLESVRAAVEIQLNLMEERRRALVTAAVTGELPVRVPV